MTDSSDLQQKVQSNLRACLISSPGGVPLRTLNRDFKDCVGENIPFKALGFASLENYLESVPNSFRLFRKDGELYVEAVKSATSGHITELVQRQKKSRKKKSGGGKSFKIGKAGFSVKVGRAVKPTRAQQYKQHKLNTPPRLMTPNFNSCMGNANGHMSLGAADSKAKATSLKRPHSPVHPIAASMIGTFDRTTFPLPEPFSNETRQPQASPITTKPTALTTNSFSASSKHNFPICLPKLENLTISNEGKKEPLVVEKQVPSRPSSNVGRVPVSEMMAEAAKKGWMTPIIHHTPRLRQNTWFYSCRITVRVNQANDSISITTEPEEYPSKIEAQERGAFLLLQEARKLEQRGETCEVTTDLRVIKERLEEILKPCHTGIWETVIPQRYQDKYGERLSNSWMSIVISSPSFTAETVVSGSRIIKYNRDETRGTSPIPVLEYPKGNTWQIYVTRVLYGDEIWFRFIGPEYSDKLLDLVDAIKNSNINWRQSVPLHSIQVGQIYLYMADGFPHRVVIKSKVGAKLRGFLIDHGDTDELEAQTIFELDRRFCTLPGQACKGYLSRLEDLRSDPLAVLLLQYRAEGKTLIAVKESENPLTLDLYLTSKSKAPDLYINDQLLHDKRTCNIPPLEENETEGVLQFVQPFENIRVQLHSCTLETITTIFSIPGILDWFRPVSSTEMSDQKSGILVKNNSMLVRGRICSKAIDFTVKVYLLDYGTTETVKLSEIFYSKTLSPWLGKIPPQCIEIVLKGIPKHDLNQRTTDMLKRIVEKDKVVVLRKVDVNENGVPVVEVLRKDNRSSVNEMILSAFNKPSALSYCSADISMSKKFPKPPIKEVGEEYFDIYVLCCVSPSNFSILPVELLPVYKNLTNELEEYYKVERPPLKSFEKGTLCAVFLKGVWNRATIFKRISDTEVSVRLADYCHICVVNNSDLKVLEPSFAEIPALAFTARLGGIAPINNEWSVDDTLRLVELIDGQKLVSVITKKTPNKSMNNECILSLQLYDTHTSEDIDINKLFIQERRALPQ